MCYSTTVVSPIHTPELPHTGPWQANPTRQLAARQAYSTCHLASTRPDKAPRAHCCVSRVDLVRQPAPPRQTGAATRGAAVPRHSACNWGVVQTATSAAGVGGSPRPPLLLARLTAASCPARPPPRPDARGAANVRTQRGGLPSAQRLGCFHASGGAACREHLFVAGLGQPTAPPATPHPHPAHRHPRALAKVDAPTTRAVSPQSARGALAQRPPAYW